MYSVSLYASQKRGLTLLRTIAKTGAGQIPTGSGCYAAEIWLGIYGGSSKGSFPELPAQGKGTVTGIR